MFVPCCHTSAAASLLTHERLFSPLVVDIAYCRNKETDKWYCFDDSRVSEVSADEVRNAEAYLLFYVKRPTDQRLKELEKIETMIAKGQAKPSDTDVKVSKLWLQTWRTTENPGPISSLGLVCKHGLLKREVCVSIVVRTRSQ